MRKTVFLDADTIQVNDLNAEELHRLGECKIYPTTSADNVIERCQDAEIVITNKVILLRQQLEKLPLLKYIGVCATGTNNIDIAAARKKNIIVSNVPSYATLAVAQHTFALLLEITNHVDLHNQAVHAGEWSRSLNFSFWKKTLIELSSLTLGIVGFGEIGQAVAKIADSMGMKIFVYTPRDSRKTTLPVTYVNKERLFRESDVVSLHCPLIKPDTYHLVDQQALDWMKPTAILLNASRGGLVDETALAKALQEHKIFAAGLDTLEQEPPSANSPLFNLKNCIITPHCAWSPLKTRQRLLTQVINNLKAYLSGQPINVV